jgi:hypothetical protein
MNTFQKVGEFAWRHKGKIIIGAVTLATGGVAAPAIAAAMGAGGLLGAAGTGTLISTLHGCALTSASLASITGSVAGGTAVITGASAAAGTAAGAAIDKIANKKDK